MKPQSCTRAKRRAIGVDDQTGTRMWISMATSEEELISPETGPRESHKAFACVLVSRKSSSGYESRRDHGKLAELVDTARDLPGRGQRWRRRELGR